MQARFPLPKLQIIVLAAGLSSRLGRPKALVRVHGLSLLRRALRCAAVLDAARIIAVVPCNAARYRSEARGMKVSFAGNARRHLGLSASVRRGILAARYSPAVLLMPVDLANLKSRELSRLIRRWQGAPRRVIARRIGAPGASASDCAAFGVTPLILPRRLYLQALEVAGDVGLRDLISRLPADSRVLVEVPSAALDIDTAQDLEGARHSFRITSARHRR
jgi:molybdenum cofactor cytidylyltransferase